MVAAAANVRRHSKPIAVGATRIVQEALNDDVELATLTRLAEQDPGFAVRVVLAVNSGAFGLSRTVSDVRQACSLLGVRGLRNLALSLVVSDMIPTGNEGTILLVNSLRRAVSARLIAEALREKQPDEFFTIGLFLEIGLLQSARGDLAGTADVARLPALHRPTYERACGRVEHPVSGAELAKQLKLSDRHVEAVAKHHAKEPPENILGRIAWGAERVAGAFEGGDVRGGRDDALAAMAQIGVPTAAAAELLDRIPAMLGEAATAFDRAIPAQEKLDALVLDANRRLVEMNNNYERVLVQLEQLIQEKDQLASQLRRANEELASVAATDALTGLPNRRAFDQALRRDLARAERTKDPLAIVMIDVDFFKKVNDTYGHAVGDVVLRSVADVVRGMLRTGDVPARLGGEEFVALLPGASAEGGQIVAERLRIRLASTPMPGPSGPFNVTASFGVASVQGAACRGAEKTLLEAADVALYEAKRSGRNRVVIAK
ncbi:MAG TPA: diguanylate cyclase [Polyangiaceae bacterium]|jgi:diguanylate cyclase (GGDEF)-like protein|nr:diguanylate cyclase [Polyangiaceae bacterium]